MKGLYLVLTEKGNVYNIQFLLNDKGNDRLVSALALSHTSIPLTHSYLKSRIRGR